MQTCKLRLATTSLDTHGDLGALVDAVQPFKRTNKVIFRYRKGTRFHESRGKHFSMPYGEGDTLGFLITLPDSSYVTHIPNTYKDRVRRSLTFCFC